VPSEIFEHTYVSLANDPTRPFELKLLNSNDTCDIVYVSKANDSLVSNAK